MRFLGFESCLADPGIWMRLVVRAEGNNYYEYILLYIDDCLVISDNAKSVLEDKIGKHWELKKELSLDLLLLLFIRAAK